MEGLRVAAEHARQAREIVKTVALAIEHDDPEHNERFLMAVEASKRIADDIRGLAEGDMPLARMIANGAAVILAADVFEHGKDSPVQSVAELYRDWFSLLTIERDMRKVIKDGRGHDDDEAPAAAEG